MPPHARFGALRRIAEHGSWIHFGLSGGDNHVPVRLAAQIDKRQRVARADESARYEQRAKRDDMTNLVFHGACIVPNRRRESRQKNNFTVF